MASPTFILLVTTLFVACLATAVYARALHNHTGVPDLSGILSSADDGKIGDLKLKMETSMSLVLLLLLILAHTCCGSPPFLSLSPSPLSPVYFQYHGQAHCGSLDSRPTMNLSRSHSTDNNTHQHTRQSSNPHQHPPSTPSRTSTPTLTPSSSPTPSHVA